MAEAAEEKHGEGTPRAAWIGIQRDVDGGPQTGFDPGSQPRQKAFEVGFVFQGADLDVIAAGQQAEFETNGPQVFKARLDLVQRTAHKFQGTRDRLEIDIVFKQRAYQILVTPGVLPQRGIFQLNHVDPVQQDLSFHQPLHLPGVEFRNRVGRNGGKVRLTVRCAHHKFHRGAELFEFLIRFPLLLSIQHHHRMDLTPLRQLPQHVIHENAAAVGGWRNGVGRDKQHPETLWRRFERRFERRLKLRNAVVEV